MIKKMGPSAKGEKGELKNRVSRLMLPLKRHGGSPRIQGWGGGGRGKEEGLRWAGTNF